MKVLDSSLVLCSMFGVVMRAEAKGAVLFTIYCPRLSTAAGARHHRLMWVQRCCCRGRPPHAAALPP
jgi:hypothetical protein